MIHSLFILNKLGDVIIEKHWRGFLNRSVCEFFWEEVQKAPSPEEVLPIISTPKFYLLHTQTGGLFFLSPIHGEVQPLLVFDFLDRVVELFRDYFGEVSEESLKDNFVAVYQLLDEMADNGYPFTTEPNILKDMIPPPGLLDRFKTMTGQPQNKPETTVPDSVSSLTSWRKAGIKYTTNEIYFDIIEEMDCIIDANGQLVSGEISGTIQCNCRLSGMPDLTLTFNNPRLFDDCSFHPCVRYMRFEHDRVLSFIPPDGVFQLMKYRVTQQFQPPLYCKPQITFSEMGGKVNVIVGPRNSGGKPIENVMVTVPFSKAVSSTSLVPTYGTAQYDDIARVCKWTIGKIPLDKTPVLSGNVAFAAGVPPPESTPTILVDFKITMFSASGIKVDSLTMINERYQPYKGVRAITKAGKFQVRST